MKKKQNRRKREQGATMLEYALGISILVGVFFIGAVQLEAASEHRFDQSAKAAETSLPCDVDLNQFQCR